jgi:ribA/ribD-fused uncharacterized protein
VIFTENQILLFWGGPLSQWQKTSFKDVQNIEYNCREQYMMYQKALLFNDHQTATLILNAQTPKEQKALGRRIQNYVQKIWDLHKMGIVWQGNYLCFSQHKPLRDFLLSTGDKYLAEASPFDLIWGVGLRASDPLIYDSANWTGVNLLGEILMSVRSLLNVEMRNAVRCVH